MSLIYRLPYICISSPFHEQNPKLGFIFIGTPCICMSTTHSAVPVTLDLRCRGDGAAAAAVPEVVHKTARITLKTLANP